MAKKRKAPKKKIVKVAPIRFPSFQMKVNPIALGYAFGTLRAVGLTGLTILGKMGYALDVVELVQKFHLTYNLTPLGIVSGLAETALWGIIVGYIFGKIYNRFA